MSVDEEERFSNAVSHFLERHCIRGEHYSVADQLLFSRFRTFWVQASENFDHPALLGQFRVALLERGFRVIADGKWPRWQGLALRQPYQNAATPPLES